MDTRFCLRTRTRAKPLALSLALAFAGALASPYGEALPKGNLDGAALDAVMPAGRKTCLRM